jgi:DNA-binding response OmpR family regulator
MRLLLVEDDPSLASSLRRALEAQKFAVTMAGDGDRGLDELCGNDYQLAILDVLLPKRDGFSVCQEARKQGITTPILMLTARDAVTDRVAGLNSGADDYLAKPFAFPELLARVHALLRRPHQDLKPRTIAVGDLSVDVLTKDAILDRLWGAEHGGNSNILEVYIKMLRRKLDDPGSPSFVRTVRGVGYTVDKP